MPGTERINIRATAEAVDLLKRGAEVKKMSLTTFILMYSQACATKILAEQKHDSVDTE